MGKSIDIILCDNCKGKGYAMSLDPKNPQEGIKVDCHRCNNTGRLRVTTTVEVEPYK